MSDRAPLPDVYTGKDGPPLWEFHVKLISADDVPYSKNLVLMAFNEFCIRFAERVCYGELDTGSSGDDYGWVHDQVNPINSIIAIARPYVKEDSLYAHVTKLYGTSRKQEFEEYRNIQIREYIFGHRASVLFNSRKVPVHMRFITFDVIGHTGPIIRYEYRASSLQDAVRHFLLSRAVPPSQRDESTNFIKYSSFIRKNFKSDFVVYVPTVDWTSRFADTQIDRIGFVNTVTIAIARGEIKELARIPLMFKDNMSHSLTEPFKTSESYIRMNHPDVFFNESENTLLIFMGEATDRSIIWLSKQPVYINAETSVHID